MSSRWIGLGISELRVELEQLADGVQLAAGRRRHHGDRGDADLVPGVEALAHLTGAAADRAVVDPGVGHQARQRITITGVEGVLDGLHLGLVARLLPVVAVVRQRDVAGQRAAVDRPGRGLVLVDHRRQHVGQRERLAAIGRDAGQLGRRVGERAVGPDRAVRHLEGEVEHLVPQRGQPDRGQRAGRPLRRPDAGHVVADVRQRLARGDPQALHRRFVADAEAEAEAPLADLGQVPGGDRHLARVPVVDRLDARPERDPRRDVGQRAAQREVAVDPRAGQPGEASAIGLGGDVEQRPPLGRGADDGQGRQA